MCGSAREVLHLGSILCVRLTIEPSGREGRRVPRPAAALPGSSRPRRVEPIDTRGNLCTDGQRSPRPPANGNGDAHGSALQTDRGCRAMAGPRAAVCLARFLGRRGVMSRAPLGTPRPSGCAASSHSESMGRSSLRQQAVIRLYPR